jgi:NADH-quinone oxidoreductase subunit J
MVDLFFFAIFATVAVLCAINVVVQRHPISSALSLVGVMASLAVLYLLLGGEFIAMAQIIVYAGAVMVLFVFVIMLLNSGTEVRRGRSWMATIFGIPALLGLLGLLGVFLVRWFPDSPVVKFGDFTGGTAEKIGYALFTGYLLPFEVTSVLILIAILGAVVLARKELD